MAKELHWVFGLLDKASGPANNVANAIHKTVVQLDAARDGTAKLTAAQMKSVNAQNRVIASYARFVTAMKNIATVQQREAQMQSKLAALDVQRARTLAMVTVAQTKAATAQARAAAAASRAAAAPHLAAAAASKAQAAQIRATAQAARLAALGPTGMTHGGGGGTTHFGQGGVFGTAMGIAGMYVTFRAVTAAVSALTNTVTALPRWIIGSGIRATAEKEAIEAGLEVQLGTRGAAQAMTAEAARFAALTPLTTAETMKGYQNFVMAGMAPNKVMDIMAGVSDLASLNMGNRAEATEGITRALVQVMAAGKFTGEEARQLRNWLFPIGDFYKTLAGGMIPALKGADTDTVKKAVEEGRVGSDAALLAFRLVMAQKGGGALGGLSERNSRTMLGLWSTLTSRPQELFMQMDKTPAWDKLKTSLENLNRALDYNSPTGARVQAVLSEAFSRWVDKLTSWLSDPAKVEKWITNLIGSLERVIPAFETIATSLSTIAEHLDKVFKFVGMSKGAVPGMNGVAPLYGAEDPVSLWKRTVPGAARSAWDWLTNTNPEVPIATPRGPSAIPSAAKKPGPLSMGDVNINIQGNATREDAKVIADEVRKALASAFEQSGLEAGV